ncbi:MAG TPA: hypothetical protein VFO25_12585 [Candidatus Eremiobacteraceae bacterium]|nr:hypothetical protein [Candidatus Eremiobacteraceae bacterium]
MKRIPAVLFVLALVTCIAAPVEGRAATSSASDLSLKLGALFPANGDSRDLGGSTQYVIGLDYLLHSASTSTSATSIYLDYLGGSKNSGSIHSTGVGVALRSSGTAYFGAGLGIYSTSVQFDEDADDRFRSNTSSTGGGGKVFAGFDLGSGVDLEFDYHILPAAGGVNPSGAALEVGIRL